jgi:outer membrane protein assembly factor BamB
MHMMLKYNKILSTMIRFNFLSAIIILLFLNKCNISAVQTMKNRNLVSSSLSITNDKLIYTTWDKEVIIEEIVTGKIIFRKSISDICYAKPVLKKDMLYFPISDSMFVSFNVKTDKLVWGHKLGGRCNGIWINNNMIILDSKHYGIIGCSTNDGKIIYEILYRYNKQCSIPDLSPYRASFSTENFYLNNWQCAYR